ncbi:MAG: DUF4384 domain-containing protein [Gemmatimonadetes bacterium]|nr:DUF4384 domain-containing protein [Gemmatimonadota bacterium]
MSTTNRRALLILAALGFSPNPGATQDSYVDDPYGADASDQGRLVVEDSLEARVWLDRGSDAVVERGDEVRVYYRTSHDAYGAIFRIDTDGRISLVYPQHPDADPFVVGGRDYRLVFSEGARWRVREDPGVGYFFMLASYQPLDFSLFGWNEDGGWDLRGVGDRVYQDPYVAIDDYVAAVLPDWETAGYALDFLEYNVDEAHDYPRFLCYDCHDYRPYSNWDPYARACSSFQVVIWDDPYFYPGFRYLGTRVVFARPIGPRPRYSVTARLVGSGPRPIVRSRPAPPRRTAVYKEAPRGARSVVPRRTSPTAASRPSAAGSRAGSVRRGTGSSLRQPPLPSARRGIPPTVRGTPASGSTSRARPTLQRRPSGAMGRTRPGRTPSTSGRATPTRPPRGVPRATPTRTPRSGGNARPARPHGSSGRVSPTRPPRSGARNAPVRPPRSGARPAPARRPPPAARSGSRGSRQPTSARPKRRPGG